MANIAMVLRQEITRLARREIRSETRVLRKASSQYRKDIAALKRQLLELKSKGDRLGRHVSSEVALQNAEASRPISRYSPRIVASQRKRLGLSAAEYGKLIGTTGVSAATIYKWEHDTSRPRKAQLSALGLIRDIGKAEARARLQKLSEKTINRQGRK